MQGTETLKASSPQTPHGSGGISTPSLAGAGHLLTQLGPYSSSQGLLLIALLAQGNNPICCYCWGN